MKPLSIVYLLVSNSCSSQDVQVRASNNQSIGSSCFAPMSCKYQGTEASLRAAAREAPVPWSNIFISASICLEIFASIAWRNAVAWVVPQGRCCHGWYPRVAAICQGSKEIFAQKNTFHPSSPVYVYVNNLGSGSGEVSGATSYTVKNFGSNVVEYRKIPGATSLKHLDSGLKTSAISANLQIHVLPAGWAQGLSHEVSLTTGK